MLLLLLAAVNIPRYASRNEGEDNAKLESESISDHADQGKKVCYKSCFPVQYKKEKKCPN